MGTTSKAEGGEVTLTIVKKHVNYGGSPKEYRDPYVNSPKSANIHPDGTKYYVNSLEGCCTVVYDMKTHERKKVINYQFRDGKDDALWSKPSEFYPFTHYTQNLNTFQGKPVEATFSHGGRYLWIPFYRRTYDLNAQDPSAVAVIDTKTDEIVKLMETGPLPKMVATSHDGKHVAITHWGNNTVGLVNVASVIFASLPILIMANPPWRTVFWKKPAFLSSARWWIRFWTPWSWNGSGASPSSPRPCACSTRPRTGKPMC